MNREMIDGKGEKLGHAIVQRHVLRDSRESRNISSRAIWPNRNVDHRMIERQGSEAELGSQERHDFHLRHQAVGMGQRYFLGTFFPVDGNVAHFYLKVERDNVKGADFGAATRDALDLRDHPAAHIRLKRLCGCIPKSRNYGENHQDGGDEQPFPPAAGSGGGFRHRVCTPSSGDSATPGILTLLSERSDCSHDTMSSLTFSCVRSSRIFAETSARGTSPPPDRSEEHTSELQS